MGKRSIFYLDDSEEMLTLFRAVCGHEYDVRTTSSLAEGLRMLNSCAADIIISDQKMPDMVGTEFLRLAQDLCPESLRILLTGEARFMDVLAEISDGVVECFICKPWHPVEMRVMLERASVTFELRRGINSSH